MRCSTCSQDTVITIQMCIAGEDVAFSRCSVCESSGWEGDEGDRSLEEILEIARVAR